jgi:hypothetical protein
VFRTRFRGDEIIDGAAHQIKRKNGNGCPDADKVTYDGGRHTHDGVSSIRTLLEKLLGEPVGGQGFRMLSD